GTVLADNPELTCRIPGFRPTPIVRIIADSHLRTPLTSRLMATAADIPTWFLLREGTNLAREDAFAEIGATLIKIPGSPAGVDLKAAMTALNNAGLTRILVEGGGQLAAAMLRADLVDRIAWFHAPSVMGGDGWPAVQAFGATTLDQMPRFRRDCITAVGDDILTEFTRQRSCSPAS
ncbi:MAG: diaminohydroxyphosphoribosylaminopyrimidine deaminase, partial [Acetobacteraceae bacterium]|nr:diaminohydroxyphosphoribosylaminopyrimidine deaminase [Acetobacteraceae bacterium]